MAFCLLSTGSAVRKTQRFHMVCVRQFTTALVPVQRTQFQNHLHQATCIYIDANLFTLDAEIEAIAASLILQNSSNIGVVNHGEDECHYTSGLIRLKFTFKHKTVMYRQA